MKTQLESFERAFDSGASGCVRTCSCGRVFYDDSRHYSWDEGELEGLQRNEKAIALAYTVGTVIFEGREYCVDCNCWHERARRIIGWIEHNASSLVEFLNLEKSRKQEEARTSPCFEEWFPIRIAPKNASIIRVKMKDGTVHEKAHWASDLSGEDQPAFQGWFIPSGKGFAGIEEPKEWMPITKGGTEV